MLLLLLTLLAYVRSGNFETAGQPYLLTNLELFHLDEVKVMPVRSRGARTLVRDQWFSEAAPDGSDLRLNPSEIYPMTVCVCMHREGCAHPAKGLSTCF